jgi:Tol biopolymer transport system component
MHRLLFSKDARLENILESIRASYRMAEMASCNLAYIDEDGDRISILTDNDLDAAFAQVQDNETFRVLINSGTKNLSSITSNIHHICSPSEN